MVESKSTAFEMANAGVRLLLELIALAVYGYWGYNIGETQGIKLALAVGFTLSVAIVWGVFGSPAAPYRLKYPWRLGLEILILGGAAVGLYLVDRPMFAVGFAVIAALNTILLYLTGRA